MLICLVATLLFYILFFASVITAFTRPTASMEGRAIQYCGNNIIMIGPILTFVVAVLLNINKWVYFRYRILSMMSMGEVDPTILDDHSYDKPLNQIDY